MSWRDSRKEEGRISTTKEKSYREAVSWDEKSGWGTVTQKQDSDTNTNVDDESSEDDVENRREVPGKTFEASCVRGE